MAENKSCKQCGEKFVVADSDLSFYKNASLTFANKTFEILTPAFCPDCRRQRRFIWRNEKKLYNRKSDLSQKDIISVFSPDKEYKIFDQTEWWSDKWDGIDFAQEYNSQESFFEQFDRLYRKVPKVNLINGNPENSDYLSYARGNKNCYLLFSAIDNENCLYGSMIDNCKDSLDCLLTSHCNLCYEGIEAENCYNCQFIQNCENCRDSKYLYDCKGCANCLYSAGLRNKSFCVFNEQLSKEDYEKFKSLPASLQQSGDRYKKILLNTPRLFASLWSCENTTGDTSRSCKNCQNIFDASDCEEDSYMTRSIKCQSVLDCDYTMAELCLEGMDIDENSYQTLFSVSCWGCKKTLYSTNCHSCQNIFGCAGLKHKEYCIFNKQYTKEEYEQKASQIIEKMVENGEWSEFFPMKIAPFGYNETLANEYYPLDEVEAANRGAKWLEIDYSQKYNLEPAEIKPIKYYIDNQEEAQKLLNSVIKCKVSGKPFKLMPQELAFYLKNEIEIPTKHYDERYKERFAKRNPRHLWHRQCMCEEKNHDHDGGRCPNEFATTYAPDRPERVYCERCYQKEIV